MKQSKPVSKNLRKTLPLIKFISSIPDEEIREYCLNHLGGSEEIFDALKEITGNYLNGRILLKPKHSKLLSREADLIKKYHCKNIRKKKRLREKVISQSGGFLPYLIPAAATIIDLVLSNYVK